MRRGETWWAGLPPPAGKRPVILLSRNEAYAVRTSVTVAPLTTTLRGIPVEVPLGKGDGLPKDCVVNLDSITTVPKAILEAKIADLSPAKLAGIRRAVKFALDL